MHESALAREASAPAWHPAQNERPDRPCRHHESLAEEEPEILNLCMAHYRALLQLRQLTTQQQGYLQRLLAQYQAHLENDRANQPSASLVGAHAPRDRPQEWLDCVTAMQCYIAGARRAQATGRPQLADQALAKLSQQVDRARALLAGTHQPAAD